MATARHTRHSNSTTMKTPFVLLLIIGSTFVSHSLAFAPPRYSFFDSLQSILIPSQTNNADDQKREEVKAALLAECGSSTSSKGYDKRKRIEDIIEQLGPLSPVKHTATSPLLQKEWILSWTTEKEINFFIDFNIAGEVSQTIQGKELGNMINFRDGGGLGVSGELSLPPMTDDSSNGSQSQIRTNFKFTSATLDLGSWGSFQIPPVGEGWFETLYLDDDLRVDINSRNDILVCTPR